MYILQKLTAWLTIVTKTFICWLLRSERVHTLFIFFFSFLTFASTSSPCGVCLFFICSIFLLFLFFIYTRHLQHNLPFSRIILHFFSSSSSIAWRRKRKINEERNEYILHIYNFCPQSLTNAVDDVDDGAMMMIFNKTFLFIFLQI